MGIQDENNQECLVMGKGVAFGKKVGQTVPVTAEAKVYSLKEMTERGDAKDILKSVSPLCLEFANEVLNQAEQEFGKVDRTILFTIGRSSGLCDPPHSEWRTDQQPADR